MMRLAGVTAPANRMSGKLRNWTSSKARWRCWLGNGLLLALAASCSTQRRESALARRGRDRGWQSSAELLSIVKGTGWPADGPLLGRGVEGRFAGEDRGFAERRKACCPAWKDASVVSRAACSRRAFLGAPEDVAAATARMER
eukprot:scaffold1881_cov256-Pinguiococcus_pyrenoidosus.AAC.5